MYVMPMVKIGLPVPSRAANALVFGMLHRKVSSNTPGSLKWIAIAFINKIFVTAFLNLFFKEGMLEYNALLCVFRTTRTTVLALGMIWNTRHLCTQQWYYISLWYYLFQPSLNPHKVLNWLRTALRALCLNNFINIKSLGIKCLLALKYIVLYKQWKWNGTLIHHITSA